MSRHNHCRWPGCDKTIKQGLWGCQVHWFELPLFLRFEVARLFKPKLSIEQIEADSRYHDLQQQIHYWRSRGSNRQVQRQAHSEAMQEHADV